MRWLDVLGARNASAATRIRISMRVGRLALRGGKRIVDANGIVPYKCAIPMTLRPSLLAVVGLVGLLVFPVCSAESPKPNVVIFLADDSGWGDYSMNGNTNLRTPNIDSIGRDGAVLDRFFVCSVCAPTRAEFLTGRYHPRGGVRGVSTGQERLNTDEKTLAEAFKAAGYATGAFGKWHNGSQWPYHPNARGFDEYYGFTSGHWGEYFDPPLDANGRPVRGKGFVADDFTDHALAFIEHHRTKPFLCYVPFNTPHSPWAVPEEFWRRFKDKPLELRAREGNAENLDETRCALAMMENLDANVGRVLRRLKDLGLQDNTIVLYFSDNGPNTWRWNGDMKGRKGSTDEGSLRSVCLMRWPGKIKAGTTIGEIAGAIDLLPTLTALTQVPRVGDKPLDGRDLSPLLLGRQSAWPDRLLFSHQSGAISARSQQYRLDNQGALFDMREDPGQQKNIAVRNPEVTARMTKAVELWRKEVLPPETDDRPFPIGYAEFPRSPLPARDGIPYGGVKRSAGAPNCSYFVRWTSLEDRMTWDIDVHTTGTYEVEILYTCPLADAGSTVELEYNGSKLVNKVAPGWDPPLYANQDTLPRPRAESPMKEFRPLQLGSIRLEKGRGLLTLRALEIPGKSVMDVRQITLTLLTAAAVDATDPAAAAGVRGKPLFDGKSLAGWEGDTNKTWRIENGQFVAGEVTRRQEKNDFLATTRAFENFDLRLQYKISGTEGFVNGGVQFRSQRIPNHHEVIGYQADLGAGYDGHLYDESRRNKVLAAPDKAVLARALKTNDWNDYRIRADGPRIQLWLNGVQTVDYTEPDAAIPRSGLIALQIHGDAKSQVRYRNIQLEELPSSPPRDEGRAPVQGPPSRMTRSMPPARALAPFSNKTFSATTNEVFVFVGPENSVIEQQTGWIETALASGLRAGQPRFRHMGWEGDTVYRQNRMQNWGSWKENLETVDATTVFVWFGQMEALDETKTPEDFAVAYGKLLEELAARTPRIVMLAPPPFELPADPRVPDNTARNAIVQKHADIARRLAAERGYVFVDVFTPLAARGPTAPRLTRDGIHLTAQGMLEAATVIATQLGLGTPSPGDENVRGAIVEKNRLWFNTWRPMNWAFAYGDRTTQRFAEAGDDKPAFVEELTRYRPLMARADETVHALLAGRPAPAPLPSEPPRADPSALSPEEEKSRFELREGFSINLFADEQLGVVRPLQMRWDEQGRLWVVCAPSYPQLQPGERANDYLIVLEDTDGDGRADTTKRVAEGLTMPMGMEFGDGGIYVCESSALVHLRDADQNGTFEERRVVLSGFGTGDTHQNINSIRWGADGALWFTQGYHIWSYVETPHGLVELNRSGLWRFNPRTLRLDSFLNESTAGLNAWGVAFDDYGQVFHASGADFVVWHTTPALIPTLHPLNLGPGLAGSRGKSMEPEFLGSSHLPDDWHGLLLKSVYFTSQVRLYRLRDDGAGFTSEDLGDLIASKGTEFRPVETRVGPDGALYICDWLNPVIGHYQASYRDPRRDRSHGRIWRMTANGRALLKRPPLEKMDVGQLMDQLNSPERWVRDQAKYALYRRPKTEVIQRADALLLTKRAGSVQDEERLLYELSGVYAAHEEARSSLVERLLASDDFRWRAWAVHLIGVWAEKLSNPLTLIQRAIADAHPRVRLEAVVACAWVPSAEAVKVATLAMEKPMDASLHYALTQCIHAQAPRWRPALAAGQLDFGQRFHAMAKVLTTVGDTSVVGRVRELLASGQFTGAVRDSLLAVLIENGGPQDTEFAIMQAPDSPAVLDALVAVAFRKQDAGYHAVLEQLLTSPHSAGRIAGCRVAAVWGQHFGQLPRILKIAGDHNAPSKERAAAITALAKLAGKEAFKGLLPLTGSPDTVVRNATLTALAPLDPDAIAGRCVALLEGVTNAVEAGALLQPLLQSKGGADVLAQAVEKKPPPAPSAKLALQWLGQAGRDDRALVDALRAAAGIAGTRIEYSPQQVANLVADALAHGDAQRGSKIIRQPDMACLGCHRIGQDGAAAAGDWPLGPDLSAAGRAMTPEMLTESVFWPKRQVKEGFLLTLVTTKDGRNAQGYKASENAAELRLRQFDGGELILRKSDIATRNDAGTLMPEGLTDALTPAQRSDVLKFLFQLGREP